MLRRFMPPLTLAVVGLALFADLTLHPTQTLYSDHSDLLALHLPSKHFLVRSWRQTGEVPLWCPYVFAGMPFVHDVQVAAFYPFTWPLYLVADGGLGAAMSWILVLHVVVAGWCAYAYARHEGLGPRAAWVTGVGYVLGGKWLLHLLAAGHYNMIPLAWLPLVLLWLERAVAGRSLLWALGAGAVFSLFVLGAYPYITLYAGVFTAAWTLAPALERAGMLSAEAPRSPAGLARALGRWFLAGICTAVAATALGAVQLLPALEASGESSRSAGVAADVPFLANSVRTLFALVGPALAPQASWENQGNFGVLWLAAAAAAPLLRRGRVRFQAEVTLGVFLYALGGAAMCQRLPAFSLFRLPVRALLVAGFPVALLAGVTTQALFGGRGVALADRRAARHLAAVVAAVFLVLVASHAEALRGGGASLHGNVYWLCLPVMAAVGYWLLGRAAPTVPERWAWTALLVADAGLLAWPLVAVRPEEVVFAPGAVVGDLMRREGPHVRVLDRPPGGLQASGPLWPGLAVMLGQEGVEGFNPVDVRRFKKYLQFVSGEDTPLTPLRDVWTYPTLPNFPVRNKPLLDLLGVAYVLQPAAWGSAAGGPGDPPGHADWRRVAEDLQPAAYDLGAGGVRRLPPYALYENATAMPRAFVVYRAEPFPPGSPLAALTRADLRRVVLLEGAVGPEKAASPPAAPRRASIREYTPNRVAVDVEDGPAGYLVLADVWYPGWMSTVDGRAAPLYQADYLFRATPVAAGRHEVVFTFAPESYRVGKWVSLVALGVLAGAAGWGLWVWRSGPTRPRDIRPPEAPRR